MSSQVDLRQLAVDRSPAAGTSVKRRNFAVRYGLPLLILGTFVGVIGWSLKDSLLPAKAVTVTPVVLARAEVQQAGTPVFQAAGWIEPRPTATVVSAQVEGMVESLQVVEGQEVERGQAVARLVDAEVRLALGEAKANLRLRLAEVDLAMATLDAARQGFDNPSQLEASLAEAEAAHAKISTEATNLPFLQKAAEARLKLAHQDLEGKKAVAESIALRSLQRAQSDFDAASAAAHELEQRAKSLESESQSWQRRVTALRKQLELKTEERRKVKEAEASLKVAEAKVDQARLAVKSAELRVSRMTIVAPIAGKVLALHAQPGRRLMGLSPASERDASAVVSLYDPDNLQVRADVRLEDVPSAQIGQRVQITTAALTSPLLGEVIAVTSQADIQKNTLQVKVAIQDPPPIIKPEMLVQVTFLAPEQPGDKSEAGEDPLRQLIPRELVKSGEQGSSVWVADLVSARAQLRSVQLGRAGTDRLVEVVQGLAATDKLIVSGRESLHPGERIRVIGEDHSLAGASGLPNATNAAPLAARKTTNQK
jgi:multidrug efflux pump subunit AcrA (membrane-fusion protein)